MTDPYPTSSHAPRRSLLAGGAAGLAAVALAQPQLAAAAPGRHRHTPADLVEQKAVEAVVLTERQARDMARWAVMAQQFHPDSLVDISWIKTSGSEFVRLSQQSFEAGGRSCHVLSPVIVDVVGDRATADTGVIIAGQVSLGGVSTFLTAYGRLVERLEKRDGTWRISQLRVIYQFDHLVPVNPDQSLGLDSARLASYRPSYSGLSYWVAETRGAAAVRDDLPGVDRPDSIKELYDANAAWLGEGRRAG